MTERRTFKRVALAEPVIVVLSRGDVVGEVRDLSLRGMFVAIPSPGEAVGAAVVVQVNPAHPRIAVDVRGVVRWCDGRGIGVELASLGARARVVLETLIESAALARLHPSGASRT